MSSASAPATAGPGAHRLRDALAAPPEMLRGELAWAVTHGLADRVRLLVYTGLTWRRVDDGVSVASMVATTGHPELIDYLVGHGAPALDLPPEDAFVAAALAVDRAQMGLLGRPARTRGPAAFGPDPRW